MFSWQPQPAFVNGFQADLIALFQPDNSTCVNAAIVSFVSEACLHQGKWFSIYSYCHTVVIFRAVLVDFKKHLGIDVIGTTLLYFQ